ncbi:hypothetical protein B7463_g2492, partial [Scytalidium lignicola]
MHVEPSQVEFSARHPINTTGNSVALPNASTVPNNVAKKLGELGVLFCNAGDEEVGQLLQHICNNPDQLSSLRAAILEEALLLLMSRRSYEKLQKL